MTIWILTSVALVLALVAGMLVVYWLRRQRESEDCYDGSWYLGHQVILDSGEVRTITDYDPATSTLMVDEDFLLPVERKADVDT